MKNLASFPQSVLCFFLVLLRSASASVVRGGDGASNQSLLVSFLAGTVSALVCSYAAVTAFSKRKVNEPRNTNAVAKVEGNIKYSYTAGVIGGLGPKASSVFYDQYIVDGRIELYQAMARATDLSNSVEDSPKLRLKAVMEISTASWSSEEIEQTWNHTKSSKQLRDQDHVPLLLYGNSQVPGRPEYILGKSQANPTQELVETSKCLLRAGANTISLVCNTAHYFIPEVEKELRALGVEAEFLNMLELTFNYIVRQTKQEDKGEEICVGVLATEGALQTGIFDKTVEAIMQKNKSLKLRLISPLTPSINGEQKNFNEAVFGTRGIKSGYSDSIGCIHAKKNMELLVTEASNLVNHGASAVILGCTELPLVLNSKSLSHNADTLNMKIDSMDVGNIKFVNPSKVLADEILRRTLVSRP
eukprot:CAMPEP_0184019304 /NCGR_PEP_ID=MMETSP0954-20121128/8673_1 /TAXON_ID=627963 /ORGANISM="Aplanochytrium sp, Strain PBS07" /LENGTH=416 /DNA_ID=CAMNT_0026300947 /DNA_START=149 /DNA_END=1399 /DNA_ORIENTATION=-